MRNRLTRADTGSWLVSTSSAQHVLDLDARLYTRLTTRFSEPMVGDNVPQHIWRLDVYPQVGGKFLVEFDDPDDPSGTAQWRLSSTVRRITPLPDLSDVAAHFAEGEPPAVSIERGWYPLMAQLHTELMEAEPELRYRQIGAKFGGLRVYTDSAANPVVTQALRDAETISYATCERCGDRGDAYVSRHGWHRTLCAHCAVILEYALLGTP